MDFSLTESQKMLKTMVHEFADKELEPIAADIDERAEFPCKQFERMAKWQWFCEKSFAILAT